MRRFLGFLAVIVFLCGSVFSQHLPADHKMSHPGGPLMSASEYSAYLERLEDALTPWAANFQKVDAAKLEISYTLGEKIMDQRNLALYQISLLRTFVMEERVTPRLWREIAMAQSIQNSADSYFVILSLLPQDKVPPEWDRTYAKMAPEAGKLALPLFAHVQRRADLLEK